MDPNQPFSYEHLLYSQSPNDPPTSQQLPPLEPSPTVPQHPMIPFNPYYPYNPPHIYNSPYPEFSTQCNIGGAAAVKRSDVIKTSKGKATKTNEGGVARRNSWAISDDKVLVSAYLNTSKDSILGTDQSGASFWGKVHEYFVTYNTGVERDVKACKNRWHNVNGVVSKFVGAYNQAKARKKSGESEDDVLLSAHTIYEADAGKKFTLDHVWLMLREDPKWLAVDGEISSKRNKINERGHYCSSSSPGTPSVPNTPSSVGDSSPHAIPNTPTFDVDDTPDAPVLVRPIGVKAAKRKAKEKAKPMHAESGSTTHVDMMEYYASQSGLSSAINEATRAKDEATRAKNEATRAKKMVLFTQLAAKENLTPGERKMYQALDDELFPQ